MRLPLILIFGFLFSVSAYSAEKTYSCYDDCRGTVGEGGFYKSDSEGPKAEFHKAGFWGARFICYAYNNQGVQFYGISYNANFAANIALNVCRQNSWYPLTCGVTNCLPY